MRTQTSWGSKGMTVLQELIRGNAQVAISLGSGMSCVAEELGLAQLTTFAKLGLRQPSVAGHAGLVYGGLLGGRRCIAFAGRLHLYEGCSLREVTAWVDLARSAGCRVFLLVNAAGALATWLEPGQLMLIADHVSLPALCGYGSAATDGYPWGMFASLQGLYDEGLRKLARECAAQLGLLLREGIYAMVWGPTYETPAEAHMLRLLGADAVGMSTVPEAMAAFSHGGKVLALSLITNVAGGAQAPSHEEVLEGADRARSLLVPLLRAIVVGLPL